MYRLFESFFSFVIFLQLLRPGELNVQLKIMPAYTTITFEFANTSKDGLVRSFYETFGSNDIAFIKVFPWGCNPDLTIEEIIEWNQTKLNMDFKLGYDEDVSNDYRQILFKIDKFTECRLFIINDSVSITFHCIIQEDKVSVDNCGTLMIASDRIWNRLPVRFIDSFGEFVDDDIQLPVARLFAYVDKLDQIERIARFNVEPLNRGFRLIRKETAQKNDPDS